MLRWEPDICSGAMSDCSWLEIVKGVVWMAATIAAVAGALWLMKTWLDRQ